MKTKIAGITVELETQDDDAVMGYCSIIRNGREYTGSLSVLESYGYLEDLDNGGFYDVPAATQDKIFAWAEQNGY